jgi:hypothetical protein
VNKSKEIKGCVRSHNISVKKNEQKVKQRILAVVEEVRIEEKQDDERRLNALQVVG